MKSREKTVMMVVAFVAIIAIVGLTTFNRYEVRKEAEQAKTEQPEKITEKVNTVEVEAEIAKKEPVSAEPEKKEEKNEEKKEEKVTFSEKEKILWPVEGDVIINYSMDQTVYFPTLDQYKYNPALIISTEEGNPVLSVTDGVVKEIKEDSECGMMVTVDLGSGYTAIYGQLNEIRVFEGEKLEGGSVIGYVAAPSKYYSLEGPNVYFKMLKNETPVNPLEYMSE